MNVEYAPGSILQIFCHAKEPSPAHRYRNRRHGNIEKLSLKRQQQHYSLLQFISQHLYDIVPQIKINPNLPPYVGQFDCPFSLFIYPKE